MVHLGLAMSYTAAKKDRVIMDKKNVIQMLRADFARFHQESQDVAKTVDELKQDVRNYMEALISQISSSGSGPLLAKTPKLPKKRGTRIKAIPENDEVDENDSSVLNTRSSRSSRVDTALMETTEIRNGRAKRGASVKAADSIKKQQSMTLTAKLRRPSAMDDDSDVPLANGPPVRESRAKRPQESIASSDEDQDTRPSKQSKFDKKKAQSKRLKDETFDLSDDETLPSEQNRTVQADKSKRTSVKRKLEEPNETLTFERSTRNSANGEPVAKKANVAQPSPQKHDNKYASTLERISEKQSETPSTNKSTGRTTRSSSSLINAQCSKKFKVNNIINETMDTSNPNETIASIYEDATGKPLPIMNSTMNPNTTVTLDKMMNATVVIEPLTIRKVFNETITIQKNVFKEPLSHSTIKEIEESTGSAKARSTVRKNSNTKSRKDLKVQKLDELMTDDESSPERKGYKEKFKQPKRVTRSSQNSSQSEDEVNRTPLHHGSSNKNNKEYNGSAIKSNYKPTALFSPYAKDSVKKRVEAFEQVAGSPKQNENETAQRVTRTKTRQAMAAASFSEAPAPTVAQKLARKSLAKAKKISLAKHAREIDETRENDETYIPMSTKKNSVEQSAQKLNAKTTPLGKSRLQVPSSVSKTQFATPSNSHNQNAYAKAMTGSRGNIVTNVDSFIQANVASASKKIDRAAEEKRRRAHEEDARRKREELLRAQAEEKKRKREEKELKNRLAREAKEKLEHEKRLKAEREREEKAKLALQMQEKQKEEMERKRIAQLQRAMEKEERRKAEEALRLKRLQEQEEQEKLLAEQRRREQEMEKRKQAEQRHLAELKQKKLMEQALQAKLKAAAQKQLPSSYKIDSDPDEEDSDDESKPKHDIPQWASKNVRQHQLAMQQYVPMNVVLRFFDAKQCTPDLRELFQGIDPKKLKRSSSANWKTPPRYSMMNCSIIQD